MIASNTTSDLDRALLTWALSCSSDWNSNTIQAAFEDERMHFTNAKLNPRFGIVDGNGAWRGLRNGR